MKKELKKIFALVVVMILVSYSFSFAASTINASANVPAPESVKTVITKVNGTGLTTSDWTKYGEVATLEFGDLEMKTYTDLIDSTIKYKVFATAGDGHFFAIDFGYNYVSGATGITQFKVEYSDTTTPQTHNLGWKATGTFVKKSINPATNKENPESLPADLVAGIGKKLLKDVNNTVTLSAIGGGWLRIYVGLVTKDPAITIPELKAAETAGEVFSPGDAPGDYKGKITITEA